MMKIAVSFIKSIFDVKTTLKKIGETSADYVHVDLMDGKFVKNKNFTMGELNKLLGLVNKPLDVHLMVDKPLKYIYDLAEFNTEYITFHYEAVKDVKEVIDEIKAIGIKVGMSIKPKTKVEEIIPFLEYLDQILVMAVEPGEGGQKFLEETVTKIEQLREIRNLNNYSYLISVDGGINEETALLVKAADMIVSGSFICEETDFEKQIKKIRR